MRNRKNEASLLSRVPGTFVTSRQARDAGRHARININDVVWQDWMVNRKSYSACDLKNNCSKQLGGCRGGESKQRDAERLRGITEQHSWNTIGSEMVTLPICKSDRLE